MTCGGHWTPQKAEEHINYLELMAAFLSLSLDKLQAHPDIDMFASRLNKQFPRYISYRPDPGAYLVDAFSVQWNDLNGYYFPPFSMILKFFKKWNKTKPLG